MKLFVAPLLLAAAAFAQTGVSWDTSGNGMLTGTYFVRMVNLELTVDGSIDRARTISGNMVFDGNGTYTLTGQVFDSDTGQTTALNIASGTYGVASNGMAVVENPLAPDSADGSVGGAVGKGGLLIGSSTESLTNNLLIAIPAATSASNSSFQGKYWVGALDFPQADTERTRNSLLQLEPNGQGGLGTVTVNGRDLAKGETQMTQTSPGSTYSFGSGGAGTLTISLPTGVASADALFAGAKTFHISRTGDYILGGSSNAHDIFFGMRAFSGTAADQSFKGAYYTAGMDEDATDLESLYLDTFYGSANALGNGTSLWHLRLASSLDWPFDYTYESVFSFGADGTADEGVFRYALGAGGDALLAVGRNGFYTLQVGVRVPEFTPPATGPFIIPAGIQNAASSSPITNSITPGEFITIYGQNLAANTVVADVPYPTTLGGVQVSINGRPAPIHLVSPTQINVIVPYATTESLVRIQVTSNGAQSNSVTLYQWSCAPGVFTIPPGGVGSGAIQHADDFSLVDQNSPAVPNEVVLIYVTGLGAVNPPVADGSAAPSNPLSWTPRDTYEVWFGDAQGTVEFAGLAPNFAGLYQMNVRIPETAPRGDVYLAISGPGCYANQAKIPIR